MGVWNIAVPVFIFIVAFVQHTGLITQTIDAVALVQLLDALDFIIFQTIGI